MNITLRIIGLLGVFLFGLLFSTTLLTPQIIEDSAKSFVNFQIGKEVKDKYQAGVNSSVTGKALDIADRLGFESNKIQQDLETNLPEKIAAVIASLCGYDCEKKKDLTQSIASGYLERIKNIEIAQNTLNSIVKGKYIEIVGNLKFDLRIFLGTNFLMFALLLLVSFLKPIAIKHLFLPGILLFASTIISSSIYIFGQDWFYVILYNDYMGFGYLAYLGIIFGILIDIAFNKARITTEIINAIANMIGSAFSVVPC